MQQKRFIPKLVAASIFSAAALLTPTMASAHCDGVDGPVVTSAKRALETGNVKLALAWVQPDAEKEVTEAFRKSVAVRKLNPQAREVADHHFFETLVRVHRAGEGAAYTGLKPAGRDLGPAIPAADKAIESGSVEELEHLLTDAVRERVRKEYDEVRARSKFDKNDVAAAQRYTAAYVQYMHAVERIFESGAAQHAHNEAH